MKFVVSRLFTPLALSFALVGIFQSAVHSTVQAADKPNVVIILADDMGYSDLGCFGSEIHTPHLDGIAGNGLRFTQFYNTTRCWPSRAALMTGYYAQQVHRDMLPGLGGGGNGNRQEWAKLLPELLKSSGYRSYHSGKWHIDGLPWSSGFDRSYLYQENGRFFTPSQHFEDGVKLPAVGADSGFYATAAFSDHAVSYLQDHQKNHSEKPFLMYLAFIAPHFPLQAEQSDIDRYRDTYLKGWDEIRQARFARQQEMGIVSTELSKLEPDVGPPYSFPNLAEELGSGEVFSPLPWNDLTEEQQKFQATKMAIHAAMVDRMDREIGKVFDQLKAMNAWENTLVLFMSDNGASAEIMIRDDGHDPSALPGSAATYLCLGPGFSSAANSPFRRHKTWTHEGGISTSFIAHWPAGIAARGELRNTPAHLIDLVPTILDLSDTSRDASSDAPEFPGKSLLPVFAKDQDLGRELLWWLHEGNRAVRAGDWKLVAAKDQPWELYDLSTDRAESNDLAKQNSAKVHELNDLWEKEYQRIRDLASQTSD